MKKGTRLYINITNRCNTDCPFCCMYSGTENTINMSFDTFKQIIDDCKTDFELQLEGGEPLLHKDLYLFIEYAIATKKCKKILMLTNGIILEQHLKRLVELSNFYEIPFEVKISINYWLITVHPGHIDNIKNQLFATEYLPYFSITCNVRLRHEDELIKKRIEKDPLLKEHSNIYYLQSYGKLKDSEYEKPVIVQNIENWCIYACDGTSFGIDLIARSEYEHQLQENL